MAENNFGPQQERSDSYVDVVFDAIRDAEFSEGNIRVYDQLARLGAANGAHFFRTGSFGAFTELVIGDYPEDSELPFPGRHLREAVIQRGHKVSHYIFDIANDQLIAHASELLEGPNERVVMDQRTPAHFSPERNNNLSGIVRRSGRGYNQWLGNRICAMELLTDESVADRFIEETATFVGDGILHVTPTVAHVFYR